MKGILGESGGVDRNEGDDDYDKEEEVDMADLLVKSAAVEACLEACTEEKERSQMVIFGVVKGDLAGPRAGFMMLQLPEGFCFLDAA
ncbi:hypothetical protein U1Q18_036454, partial [Sarracenia purpurea var. burkii]